MGGGIMQLTANGIQDEYITGNPQITFFKSVYRRHTNFAIESVQQIIDGDLGTATTPTNSTVKISKTADLINGIYVVCPQHQDGINATELITNSELIIGGTIMDRHTNEWMKVWNELTVDAKKKEGYKYMVGGFNSSQTINNQSSVIIPLNFWFCRHIGLSLPLISILYHDIILKIEWGINQNIYRKASSAGTDTRSSLCEVWSDNIFLDSEERKRFGENEHEYLIEQVQIIDTINQSPSSKFKLNSFNHPLKEIIWTEDDTGVNKISNEKINITINGIERLSEQYKEYYTLKQPYIHHTNIPSYNIKEHEDPIFLENPIPSTISKHKSNDAHLSPDGVNIQLGSNSIKYHDNTTLDTIGMKVGDIITLRQTPYITHIVTITSIDTSTTTKEIVFSPNIEDPSSMSDDTDVKVNIIARRDYSKSSYSKFSKNIYVYSFCLNPEEHQPSGTCNFSRFDDCKLNFTSNVSIDKVFATNYNILRISNGLVNLRFSN
tara:strand:- start:8355 stop:9833 length:1479 start_codon:yes stop_codon:yes gene_type:complete